MKRTCNIFLIAVFITAICIVGQSTYWQNRANKTKVKSSILSETLNYDMEMNLHRIEENLPIKEDTVLIKTLEEMRVEIKYQQNKSILYKWFRWEVL